MMRRFLLASSLFLSLFAGGFTALPVHAQLDTGLQAIGDTIRLPSTDPRVIAARIINVALGLIGIILVVLLIYAGFLYMTSAGDESKIEKALGIIKNAVIGLIIILSAWAITTYVINALLKATQDGGGGVGGTGAGGFGGGFGGGAGGSSFQVQSITPQGNVPIRNVQVRFVFNKSVDESTAGAITVLKDGVTAVGGTLAVEGSVVTFTPTAACPAPNESRKCFDGDSDFTVKVNTSLKSASGQSITCGGFALPCTGAFHTGNLVDTQVPVVRLSFPTDGMSVQANFSQDVIGEATDDSGVAMIEFFDGTGSIGVDGPSAIPTPASLTATIAWDTVGASLGLHTLSASASDIDSNTSKSANVSVVVRAEHCFDTLINGGETGLNCGGDSNSPEYCGACSGGTCSANADCSSGFCQSGVCVEKPVISGVVRGDGAPGNFVTISGVNFGIGRGKVMFLGDPANPADDLEALAPTACVSAGASTWSSTAVIVAVPDGAASGPIEIRNVGSGLSDRTDQDPGTTLPDFQVNNAIYPGVCAIQPSEGFVNDESDIIGQGFGSSPSNVIFGPATLTSFSSWTDGKIRVKVPVVNTGAYPVSVRAGASESNTASYTVKDKALGAAPVIEYVDPVAGPKQEYVTVSGKNFGYSIGNVIFTENASGLTSNGDVSFPPECSDKFWTNDHIVIKVPSTLLNSQPLGLGAYTIKVKRSDGALSNSVGFDVTTGSPKPGICAISPSIGPVATVVKLIGEHFGVNKPVVTFSTGKLAVVDSNSQSSVTSRVPVGSVTGPVTLKAATLTSNKVDFQVRNCNETLGICGPANAFQCCATGECRPAGESCGAVSLTAEYAWQTSTGLIPLAPRVIEECRPDIDPAPTPSPSPWKGRSGGDQAPIDADIVMRFSRTLQQPIRRTNFQVLKCVGTGSNPCDKTENKINSFNDPIVVAENMMQDTVTLQLIGSEKLEVNTSYLVTVSTDIKAVGASGANMEEMKSCGKGPNGETYGYCFEFRTRESSSPTVVGAVGVTPKTFSMHTAAQEQAYKAVPLAEGDQCIVLNCKNYEWNWYTGANGNDSRASITNDDVDNDGDVDCVQRATGHMETGEVPVDVSAGLAGTSLFGAGLLYITFIPPHVEAFAPNCDEACLNALVWARFSSTVDSNSITPSNVELRKCFNENCVESELGPTLSIKTELTTPPFSTDELMRLVTITPLQPLEPSAFYRVLLKGGPSEPNGIKGLYGVPMDQLNHPQGFQWTFRVKVGQDAFCVAERVDVVPLEKLETVIDGRQVFVATPFTKPDVCSADGQALVASNTTWASSRPTVADLYKIEGSLIDTGGVMSAGCTGSCLAAGANGLYGRVAVCGNGIIETTDARFCLSGVTPTGKTCQVLGAGAKAGEECEPSIDGQDLCSAQTCLYRPISAFGLGGSCGDGSVQKNLGEACDFGPTCVGGSNATSSTPVPENTPCLTQSAKDACIRAKGDCSMHAYRGCSAACRHQGSVAGQTICGNSDYLGDGKDCDDGNTTAGDGCSAICLHEGSVPTAQLSGVCGNAVLEPGEVCERPSLSLPFPAGCSTVTCLHTGKIACASTSEANCCGNGAIESGEDCDDLNHRSGDGCTASCLFEGSNPYYQHSMTGVMRPSFCGNGLLEQGEQCEAGVHLASNRVATQIDYSRIGPGSRVDVAYGVLNSRGQRGDGKVDRIQLGYIKPNAVPDPATGIASTTLTATVENKDGTADYGLQCGYTSELSCVRGTGLDDFGCCRERPVANTKYPLPGASGVCRNVQLSATFNVAMKSDTVTSNFEVSQLSVANTCPQGTQEVIVKVEFGPGIWNWFKKTWHTVTSWWMGTPAYAAKWCKGLVTGQLKPTTIDKAPKSFAFTLDKAFAANTEYLVRFLGDDTLADNAQLPNKKGVKTEFGVVQLQGADRGALAWKFTTGDKLCSVNVVTVTDEDSENHPYLFINAGNAPETRSFKAVAQSVEAGMPTPLSPVAEYAWSWEPWTSSDITVVKRSAQNTDVASFTSEQKNGNAILTATLAVTNDTINVPPTSGEAVAGIAPVTVQVCENPWPALNTSPFRDVFNSVNLVGGPFYNATPYNFSTMYCMDAGVPAIKTDDLPRMDVTQVPATTLDAANGILRQYLFIYGAQNPELKQDGIGIRIMRNDLHLSPIEWYRYKRFTGNPKPITVDGYPAVQDGTTIYVAAANAPLGENGSIYSNIYLISHNPNATETTKNIYNQLVENLTFNINPEFNDQSNTCRKYSGPTGGVYIDPVYRDAVACTADWECVKYDPNLYCDSKKAKLIRDTIRIADFQLITAGMESRKDSLGRYPQASAGTFLRGISTSLWSSWVSEIGSGGQALPVDPINRFLTCGRCSGTQTPCTASTDCEVVEGGAKQECLGGKQDRNGWSNVSSTDPATCWDSIARQFICPRIGSQTAGLSRFYRYSAENGGLQYRLSAEFELQPGGKRLVSRPRTSAPLSNWWSPELPDGVWKCVTTSTFGQLCGIGGAGNDALCRPCSNPLGDCRQCKIGGNTCTSNSDCTGSGNSCDEIPTFAGACRKFAGSYTYANVCSGTGLYSENGTCGDGVINTGEVCEIGETKLVSCNSETGHKVQACNACTSFSDDPLRPLCVPDSVCGNGRIDKMCQNENTKSCLTSADCSSGLCINKEMCDEGALNGTYGHCNNSCNGTSGYCGDGQISPGEICDNGSANGEYNSTCSLDCRGVGPYCGDQTINGSNETCDGGTRVLKGKVCRVGTNMETTCTTDADCGTDGDCGGGTSYSGYVDANGASISVRRTNSCEGVYKVINGIRYETQHVQTCKAPGVADSCTWPGWSKCEPIGACGDGVKDLNEECDEGQENADNHACTSECKRNICGDSKVLGDVEDCDAGVDNGKTTCDADYNSSCLSCSSLCKFQASAGGYCGDRIKNGAEQCDGTTGLFKSGTTKFTCSELGFDYGTVMCSSSCAFSECKKCSENPGTGEIKGRVWDAVFQQVVPNARVTLLYKGVKVDEAFTNNDGAFEFKTLNTESACATYRIVIDMYQDNPCTNKSHDGVNCNAPAAPPFTYPYDIDEGSLGGYFPYTSVTFQHSNFISNVGNGTDGDDLAHIDIFPRPEKMKAYIAVTWKSQATQMDYRIHTVLPTSAAFTATKFRDGEHASRCDYASRAHTGNDSPQCTRDVYGFRGNIGDVDLQRVPYARLICLHRAGEKTGIWDDPETCTATTKCGRGCPLEGTDACLQALGKSGADYCLNSDGTNKTGKSSDPACMECKALGNYDCKVEPDLDNCGEPAKFSPISSIVNYAPLTSQTEPIGFYLTGSSGDSSGVRNRIRSSDWKFVAYGAISPSFGDSVLYAIKDPSGSSGWIWHVADLDVKNEVFVTTNAMKGTDNDAKTVAAEASRQDTQTTVPVPGFSVWTYWFQGFNNYCLHDTTKLLNPDTSGTILCRTQEEKDACEAKSNYSCRAMSAKMFSQFNY